MSKSPLKRLSNSLTYPFSNPDAEYKPVLVGGLLIMFSFLIFPLFAVFGYQIRVYRSSLRNEHAPDIEGVLDMTIEGIKATLVLLPAFLAISLLVYSPTLLQLTGAVPIQETALDVLFFLLSLASFFISPLFVLIYAETKDFKSTYDISRLKKTLGNKDYIIGMSIFLLLIGLVQVLLVIPSFLIVTIPFVSMYGTIVSASYLGDFFRQFSEEANRVSNS